MKYTEIDISSIQELKGLWQLISNKLKIFVCLAALFGTIGHVIYAMIALLLASRVGALAQGEAVSWQLMIVTGMGLAFLGGLCKYVEQYFNHFVAFTVLGQIRVKVFDEFSRIAPGKLEAFSKGDVLKIATDDVESLEVFYAHTLSPILIGILTLVSDGIILGVVGGWEFAVLYVVCYCLLALVLPLTYLGLANRKATLSGQVSLSYTGLYLDSVQGIRDLLLAGRYGQTKAALSSLGKDKAQAEKGLSGLANLGGRLSGLIVSLAIALFALLGGYLAYEGAVSPVNALEAFVVSLFAFGPALSLAVLPGTLSKALAGGKRIVGLLYEKPFVEDNESGHEEVAPDLRFANVSFAYPHDVENALTGIDVSFGKNGVHAIFGKSGSGKSTFLKLALRYYDPQKGEVYLGHDVKDIKSMSLRENVGVMRQDPYLFHETIRENMLEAVFDASDAKIDEALSQAGIKDFVYSLPQGLDTMIDSDDWDVSTGQRQRLALARIMLRHPKLLLLDEPTAYLDRQNETHFLLTLREYGKDHSVIMVTHSLNALSYAEDSFRMEKGHLTPLASPQKA